MTLLYLALDKTLSYINIRRYPGEKKEQNFDVVFSLVILHIIAYFYVNVIITL